MFIKAIVLFFRGGCFSYIKKHSGRDAHLNQLVCDRPKENNIVVNHISGESDMADAAYRQTEIKKDQMKIIIEYPESSENDDRIKDEIREILFSALEEQMRLGSKEGSLWS